MVTLMEEIFPHVKIKNAKWLPFKADAAYYGIGTYGFIFKKPHISPDDPVIVHEYEHVIQCQDDILMPLKYLFSRKRRQEYEVRAYADQVLATPNADTPGKRKQLITELATYLSTRYFLGISHTEAYYALKKEVERIMPDEWNQHEQ